MNPIVAILFVGALGTAVADMKPAGVVLTFESERGCYLGMALGIERLNEKFPTKDFAASCGRSERLTMNELATRAMKDEGDRR